MPVLTGAFNSVARYRLQHQADDELRTRAAAVATAVDTRGTRVRVLESANDAPSTPTSGSTPAGICWNSRPPQAG
jgi:hypothetical protein